MLGVSCFLVLWSRFASKLRQFSSVSSRRRGTERSDGTSRPGCFSRCRVQKVETSLCLFNFQKPCVPFVRDCQWFLLSNSCFQNAAPFGLKNDFGKRVFLLRPSQYKCRIMILGPRAPKRRPDFLSNRTPSDRTRLKHLPAARHATVRRLQHVGCIFGTRGCRSGHAPPMPALLQGGAILAGVRRVREHRRLHKERRRVVVRFLRPLLRTPGWQVDLAIRIRNERVPTRALRRPPQSRLDEAHRFLG